MCREILPLSDYKHGALSNNNYELTVLSCWNNQGILEYPGILSREPGYSNSKIPRYSREYPGILDNTQVF